LEALRYCRGTEKKSDRDRGGEREIRTGEGEREPGDKGEKKIGRNGERYSALNGESEEV
jgi:hypothetical protein